MPKNGIFGHFGQKFLSSKLMLYHMGGPIDLSDGLKCPKKAFLAILDQKFLSSKLMLYHMGGPTDLADGSK